MLWSNTASSERGVTSACAASATWSFDRITQGWVTQGDAGTDYRRMAHFLYTAYYRSCVTICHPDAPKDDIFDLRANGRQSELAARRLRQPRRPLQGIGAEAKCGAAESGRARRRGHRLSTEGAALGRRGHGVPPKSRDRASQSRARTASGADRRRGGRA